MLTPPASHSVSASDLFNQAKALKEVEPKEALELAKQALALVDEAQDKELWYKTLLVLCEVELLLGNYHSAFAFAHQASEHQPSERLHQCLGMAYAELGDNAQALQHFFKALELLKDQKATEAYVACLNNMSIVYQMQGDYALELSTLQEALVHLDANNKFGLALIHNNIASAQVGLKEFDLALHHAKQAYELAQQTDKHALICTVITTLAEAYLVQKDKENLSQALAYLERSLAMTAQLGLKSDEILATKFMGEAYAALGETEQAVYYLERAVKLGQTTGRKHELSKAYLSLAEVYKRNNEFEKAFVFLEKHYKLNEELFNAQADRNLKNLQVLHDTRAISARADAEKDRADDLEARVVERTRALERSQLEVLERLSMAARHRDGETAEHTKRVGAMAARIAQKLDCDEAFVRSLALAARLHDLGKIGVPDSILLKPDKLTDEEFSVIKRHTIMGAGMLAGAQSELMQMAQEIALCHHEYYDGTGYPRGLAAETIPLEGRIVAVVDTFDALMNERPYKKAWPKEDALAEIKLQSGKMFDPVVVKAFLQIVD